MTPHEEMVAKVWFSLLYSVDEVIVDRQVVYSTEEFLKNASTLDSTILLEVKPKVAIPIQSCGVIRSIVSVQANGTLLNPRSYRFEESSGNISFINGCSSAEIKFTYFPKDLTGLPLHFCNLYCDGIVFLALSSIMSMPGSKVFDPNKSAYYKAESEKIRRKIKIKNFKPMRMVGR